MAFPRIGGTGIGLNLTGALGNTVGSPNNPTVGSNALTLPAGQTYVLPSGTYQIYPGSYTSFQFKDPVSTLWRSVNAENSVQPLFVDSDGANFRLANLTGCVVGGLITNAGSGLTNGIGTVTITPSAGASTWVSVVGGAINSTVTITAGGSNYTYAPILVISPPPVGGIQATATCTISGGAVNAVTVTNQGAGYTTAPTITVINDSRDTTGAGAVLTVNATLAGSGTLTAMYPTNNGTALTAVPTFTFSPASTIAATAVMNFVVTGLTVTGGGTAVPAGSMLIAYFGAITAGTRASNTAGAINDTGLTQPRPALISPNISGGVIQGTGNVLIDSGFGFQAVPGVGLISSTGVAPTAGTNITATVGGISDTSFVQPV